MLPAPWAVAGDRGMKGLPSVVTDSGPRAITVCLQFKAFASWRPQGIVTAVSPLSLLRVSVSPWPRSRRTCPVLWHSICLSVTGTGGSLATRPCGRADQGDPPDVCTQMLIFFFLNLETFAII